ncbi:hypothetical protein JYU34_000551 [Plutella xylostella]|uniref:Protein grindelwald n=1 Tax=Plutella xylostella TaxID=51655 RepID=A0ABQ7R842_PLUXY|nr:hypothetical protein JYU34_000551 [Plutella xylostella]
MDTSPPQLRLCAIVTHTSATLPARESHSAVHLSDWPSLRRLRIRNLNLESTYYVSAVLCIILKCNNNGEKVIAGSGMHGLPLCLLALAASASAQLTLTGVKCGQLKCAADDYCSPDTDRCAPCSDVCMKTGHNFDEGLCVKECQGYIHNMQYPDVRMLVAGVESTRQQAHAALIISCVTLVAVVLIMAFLCTRLLKEKFSLKYIRQKMAFKNRVKQHPADLVHHNPHAELPKPKAELKLDIRNPEPPKRNIQPLNVRDLDNRTSQTEKSQGATTPKTMMTNLSNRHPAEDTTLDYSYDNRALNVTPPALASASHNF